MGRHSSTTTPQKTVRAKRTLGQRLYGLALRTWRLLPDDFRRRIYHLRRKWRAWLDNRYARRVARKIRDWTAAREWDDGLPKDPSMWTDDWQWGSVGVAAALRTHRRQRGDLLPDHKTQEQS